MKKLYKKLFRQEKQENTKLKEFLVNAEYYYKEYPEVRDTGLDAIEHYETLGWREHKNPSIKFDTARYLNTHQDVKKSGVNPLTHYITHGYLERREVHAVNEDEQLSQLVVNIEGQVTANVEEENHVNLEQVREESVIESECLLDFLFDEEYYLAENPDIKEAGVNAYEHFTSFGWKEGRNPSVHFNVEQYLQLNKDIKEAGINPLLHYANYGRHEGRKLTTSTPPKERFFDAYTTLNVMHAGGSTAPMYAPSINSPIFTEKDTPKVIAFYLPQYHPFKENDEWWGKGFTEWTNVAKAVPQFEDHYQPRLPSDLGYYDLRLPEVMKEQTEMAAAHGIGGFCFHYYWFAGHRLMERPIEQYLAEKDNINFPFCLCWANENWTRRWDGSENDILMAQEHSEEDNEAVFYDLLRHFKDERYIKVDGKPMLVIYRPDIIPNINELSAQLRQLAIKEGLPGLHLVATNAFGFDRHKEVGFDAIVEFPPHNVIADGINTSVTLLNDNFSGHIFEYDDVVQYSLDRLHSMEEDVASVYYPTVMTGWDNSARKPGKGNVFHNATPAKFQSWFEGDYRWSQKSHPQGAKFVFVNAWNEWAEGTYLEPDKKYGYAYLNAVRSTINEVLIDAKQLNKFAARVTAKKQSDSVVVAHVFYEDLVDEICDEIIAAKKYKQLDVVISIPVSFSLSAAKLLVKRLKPVKLVVSENRGRDVWPFLQTLTALKDMNYKYGCKIHSKKSTHIAKGSEWRRSIYSGLLSESAMSQFEHLAENNEQLAISAPNDFMHKLEGASLIDNVDNFKRLLSIYDFDSENYQPFVAGTMFWFSFDWAEGLESELVNRELFGPELGAIDGTIAHGFERFFTTHALNLGYKVLEYRVVVDYVPYS